MMERIDTARARLWGAQNRVTRQGFTRSGVAGLCVAALAASGLVVASASSAFASSPPKPGRPMQLPGGPFAGPPPTGTVLYVATTGSDTESGTTTSNNCETRAEPCATIQHAIAVAPSGATVVVEAGTYTTDLAPTASSPGGIELYQPVTLEAEGAVTLTGEGPIFSLYDASSPSAGVVGPITIRGFQFQDVTGSGYNGVITTPGYGAGEVTIADNSFSNTTDEAIGYHGNAGLASPLGTGWQILDNRITDVTHSTRDGIFLGNLSDSTVEGNEVSDTGHGGILLTGAGQGDNVGDQLLDNLVSDIPYEGIQVADGDGVLVKGNTVTGAGQACMASSAPSGCGTGAVSSASAFMLYNADQTNVTVIDNTASNSYDGLSVGQPPYSGAGLLGSGIAVLQDDFTGDTNAGVADYAPTGSAPLNAMLDWWGCASGPEATGSSTTGSSTTGCTAAVGSVDVTPWAVQPVAMPPAPPILPGPVGPGGPFHGQAGQGQHRGPVKASLTSHRRR